MNEKDIKSILIKSWELATDVRKKTTYPLVDAYWKGRKHAIQDIYFDLFNLDIEESIQ